MCGILIKSMGVVHVRLGRRNTDNSDVDMLIISVVTTRSPTKSTVPQINLEPTSSTNKPIN